MLIEIESVYGDKIVHGKHIKQDELKKIVKNLISTVGEENFTTAFCLRYDYQEVACSQDIIIDYVIDLDTHLILKPKY
ncbi:MAG: hypothetical protein E7539_07485 [Ruminococcaceae bacterium]|nr:hypothetical protein [Oscillospiraceae bacterium]